MPVGTGRGLRSTLGVAGFVLAAAGWGVVVSLGWLVASAGPAVADSVAACSTTTGVIVAVDFSHWGGDVEVGCDPMVTTGYDALQTAGFAPAGDLSDGPAFICRITDPATGTAEPAPTEDSCVNTPPATAYWSYWHANPGQDTWTKSQLGATSYRPQPGSVDAWAYGAANSAGTTGQPSFSPSAVMATNIGPTLPTTTLAPTTTPAPAPAPATTLPPTTLPPTTLPPTTLPPTPPAPPVVPVPSNAEPTTVPPAISSAPANTPVASPSTTAPVPPTRATTSTTAAGGATTPVSPTTSSTSPSTTVTTTEGKPKSTPTSVPSAHSHGTRQRQATRRIVDVAPASAHPGSSGSPVPLVVGVIVAVGLGGSAGYVAWRRRRST